MKEKLCETEREKFPGMDRIETVKSHISLSPLERR